MRGSLKPSQSAQRVEHREENRNDTENPTRTRQVSGNNCRVLSVQHRRVCVSVKSSVNYRSCSLCQGIGEGSQLPRGCERLWRKKFSREFIGVVRKSVGKFVFWNLLSVSHFRRVSEAKRHSAADCVNMWACISTYCTTKLDYQFEAATCEAPEGVHWQAEGLIDISWIEDR